MILWYLPLSIHLVAGDSTIGISGLAIATVDADGKNFDCIILSISHCPTEAYVARFTCSEFCDESQIRWIPAKIISDKSLCDDQREGLYQDLKEFENNGFSLIPLSSNAPKLFEDIRLLTLKPSAGHLEELFRKGMFERLHFTTANILDDVILHAFPFSFTDVKMFGNFKSQGRINYKCTHENKTIGYLSDTKYLENISGSLATVSSRGSVGLVLGSLRRKDGNGEILYIVSWNVLFDKIKYSPFNSQLSVEKLAGEKEENIAKCVCPIIVGSKNRVQWGTCVYFSESILITNYHVINDYDEKHEGSYAKIAFDDRSYYEFSEKDVIVTPYKNLDLSFIFISEELKRILSKFAFDIVDFGTTYNLGDAVHTESYGLFYRKNQARSIKTTGIVSTKHSLPFHMSDKKETTSLIVTSASCWNGSSGGGLFLLNTKTLIGIICCNAQVTTNFSSGALQKTEKVPSFSLCIPIEIILKCLDDIKHSKSEKLHKVFVDSWRLNHTYQHIYIDGPKL